MFFFFHIEIDIVMASNTKQKKPKVSLRGRTAQWEWENDRSVWQQYSTDVQEELTRAFDQGQAEVCLIKEKSLC